MPSTRFLCHGPFLADVEGVSLGMSSTSQSFIHATSLFPIPIKYYTQLEPIDRYLISTSSSHSRGGWKSITGVIDGVNRPLHGINPAGEVLNALRSPTQAACDSCSSAPGTNNWSYHSCSFDASKGAPVRSRPCSISTSKAHMIDAAS